MNLTTEASYLYVYSKELVKLNKRIKRLSRKAEKHAHKHGKASSHEKKHKHKRKHESTIGDIKSLMKKHNQALRHLKHHYLNFHHALKKEHNT